MLRAEMYKRFLSGSEVTEDSVASQLMFKRLYELIISANKKAAGSRHSPLTAFYVFQATRNITKRLKPHKIHGSL